MFHYGVEQWLFQVFQFNAVSMPSEKARMRSIHSPRSFPSIAFDAVPVLVGLAMTPVV